LNSVVKIPERLYQVTRDLKNQKDVEFYYVLKRLDNSGFIHKRDLISKTSNYTKLSTASIYRRVDRLLRLKWLKKTSNGYRLCTYKTLFKILGYRERFHYTNIIVGKNVSAIELSVKIEIERKLQKQAFTAVVALSRDKTYQRSYKKTRGKLLDRLDQVVQDQLAYMVKKNQQAKEIAQYRQETQSFVETSGFCNPDITMSHETLKDFLHLSSTSQVYYLLKGMQEKGMVDIERDRRVLVDKNISYFEFLKNYGDYFYRYKNRNAYKILPNKYFFKD
jgi:hypothetical protein